MRCHFVTFPEPHPDNPNFFVVKSLKLTTIFLFIIIIRAMEMKFIMVTRLTCKINNNDDYSNYTCNDIDTSNNKGTYVKSSNSNNNINFIDENNNLNNNKKA